jgi:type II secretory pathway pseudopilin PulG
MATRPNRTQRGITLLENMLAMAVLLIGATGVAGIQRQSTAFLGDSRKITRAATFAGDLAAQIQLWDFDDPRLVNPDLGNDADLGDSAFQFQVLGPPPADHGEGDLTLGGRTWAGLPRALLDANGMERYWNVSYVDVDSNGNAIPDAVRVAVIVRWRTGSGWRRIVVPVVKVNPAERM